MGTERILAQDTPANLRQPVYENEREPTMEESLISVVEVAREHNGDEQEAAA